MSAVRNALVVVAATAVAYSSEVTGHHFFSLTGKTAKGLPPFKAPPLSETVANGTVITFSDIAKVRYSSVVCDKKISVFDAGPLSKKVYPKKIKYCPVILGNT